MGLTAKKVYAVLNKKIKDMGRVSQEDINNAVNDYLDKNPVQSTPVDKTLAKEGEAADAKVVGNNLNTLKEDLSEMFVLENLLSPKNGKIGGFYGVSGDGYWSKMIRLQQSSLA